MSGIRFIIALVFLIAGVETELRADASHYHPADSQNPPQPSVFANPTNKTSLEKLTIASGLDLWILPARVRLPESPFQGFAILARSLWLITRLQSFDSYCVSGSSPPTSSLT